MSIKLSVPYDDKEKVKFLGAKWSIQKKSWYLPTEKIPNLDYCYKWLSKEQQECNFFVLRNNLYLYKSTTTCYKCNNKMNVICFASKSYEDDYKFHYIYTYITLLSKDIITFIEGLKTENIKYEKRYSATEKRSYYMNVCSCCNSHQGDYFMFFNFESPFLNLETKDVIGVKLEQEFDIPMTSNIISSANYCITEYPKGYFDDIDVLIKK